VDVGAGWHITFFSVPEQWKKRVFFIFDVIVPLLLVLVLTIEGVIVSRL